jgi:hypothetical protein
MSKDDNSAKRALRLAHGEALTMIIVTFDV